MADKEEATEEVEEVQGSVLLDAVKDIDRENPKEVDDHNMDDFELPPKEVGWDDDEEEEVQSTEKEDEAEEETPEEVEAEVETEEEDEEDLPETASEAARDSFSKLREAKKKWKDRSSELEQELESLREAQAEQPTGEDLERIKAELEEYKSIVENEHFKLDPAFKSEYEIPVTNAYNDLVKWAQAGLASDAVIEEASPHINKMAELLGKEDKEPEFLQAASKAAEFIENDAFKNRFLTSAEKWFEAGKNYNLAVADREETQTYLTGKRKEKLNKSRRAVPVIFKSSIDDWEKDNKEAVRFYKMNKDLVDYDGIKTKGLEKAEKVFEAFYETGNISRELSDFVASGGIVGEVQRQSQAAMVDLLQKNSDLIKDKNKIIEGLEEKLSALGGKRKKKDAPNRYKEAAEKNQERSGSVLVDALKKRQLR